MNIDCVPPAGMTGCDIGIPPVRNCEGKPIQLVLLLNGGDCSQSYHFQTNGDDFECNDFNGGVPTERGSQVYIYTTNEGGSKVYHDGWVSVGDLFTHELDGIDTIHGGPNAYMSIYSSDDIANPANLLQVVKFHQYCQVNTFLKDKYGASQLVIWANYEQGTASCFANQTFNFEINVPINDILFEGESATINSLTVASNVEPFFYDLSAEVAGQVVQPGDSIQSSFTIPIDLTVYQEYNILITLQATTSDGRNCTGTALSSFTAGEPLAPMGSTPPPGGFAPIAAPGTDGGDDNGGGGGGKGKGKGL